LDYKLIIAVRHHLSLSRGKTAVQVAHAAVGCVLAAQKTYPRVMERWLLEGQKKVVVRIPGLKELFELEELARKRDIIFDIVTDAGRTEVKPGTITCIGLGPDKDSVLDEITGELKLI